MRRVAILIDDDLSLFELGCGVELFSLPRPEFGNWYQTEIVTFEQKELLASGGIRVSAKHITTLDGYDMLVVPCWPVQQEDISDVMRGSIIELYQRGGRIISFCSGAFLLAEVGLLTDRAATTHWRYAEQFKDRYPRISYIDDVLYVYDGRLGCSAGSAAAIDLGIEVIRTDFGYEVANQVAKRLVMAAHRSGGQSQFVEAPLIESPNQFAATLDWALENLAQKLNINLLAKKANMSRRTFDRKFRASLNMAPKAWLIQQQLSLAKRILETTDKSIELVAMESGFENAMTMRHHFRKSLHLSPSQFRLKFACRTQNKPSVG